MYYCLLRFQPSDRSKIIGWVICDDLSALKGRVLASTAAEVDALGQIAPGRYELSNGHLLLVDAAF